MLWEWDAWGAAFCLSIISSWALAALNKGIGWQKLSVIQKSQTSEEICLQLTVDAGISCLPFSSQCRIAGVPQDVFPPGNATWFPRKCSDLELSRREVRGYFPKQQPLLCLSWFPAPLLLWFVLGPAVLQYLYRRVHGVSMTARKGRDGKCHLR